MNQRTTGYALPPVVRKADGSERRVGFELEFSGVTLEAAAAAVHAALGGEACTESAAMRSVNVAQLGEFRIELDWEFLKRTAAAQEAAAGGEERAWLEPLSKAAARLVPVEVVCPPLAVSDLARLDPLVEALREAGAVGTEESFIAAYGVHINAEIPALDAATLDAYLRAFALLQWWLVDTYGVDVTRRISPYIDLFPEAYVEQLLARSTPGMDVLFDDYLAHNATRNRALDLFPLLAEIDAARVKRALDDPRIRARPTFHYRLPDCHVEQADWSLAEAWRSWLYVERLAQQPEALAALGAAFLEAQRPLFGVSRKGWVETVGRWLEDRASA